MLKANRRIKLVTKEFTECPFCGGKIIKKYSGLKDRFDTTKITFSISECTNCKVGFLNPMPIGDASAFYPDSYLSGEVQAKKTYPKKFDFEKWYRYNQYKYDFNLLKRATGLELRNAKSYVDIGCGSGERVTFAMQQGCAKVTGVDKFDFAKDESKQKAEFISSEIVDFNPSKKFQVASLFHVLEHAEKPEMMLVHISKNILDKNGYLIVQVPNYGSFERFIFKSRWFSFDVPRHLWQFNENVVSDLLRRSGYKIEKSYQTNAPLHPVTVVPSIHRELDIQRIWVNHKNSVWRKKLMTVLWVFMTFLTIPVTIIQNAFKRSSMLTIIASNESQ